MFLFLSFLLFSSTFCQYKELSKHGSVKVIPETKVYMDISSFKTGELISFEITMDLFYGSSDTDSYTFKIDQVPASNYYDPDCWNNLRIVTNKNVTKSGDDYTFSWEEIKQEGKNYIYIFPPAPFPDFYTFWGEKIKITNLGGGLSTGAIIGIVLGVIFFIIILIILIFVCCYCCKCGNCCLCCRCCSCCPCCRRYNYNVQVNQPIYPQPVYSQPAYPQPVYPQPVYPQPVYPQPAYPQPAYSQPVYQQPLSTTPIIV